jgi:nicotinamidase-related amidase
VTAKQGLEPIGPATALIVIDMQRLFAEPTEWQVPGLAGIVPAVRRLVAHRPAAAVFTRFVTPNSADDAPGRWRHYYRRWSSVTLDRMAPEMLDLMPELAPLAQAGAICDKSTYSALADGMLADLLAAREVKTLILAGVETDVCVLTTALDAVDLGYRVVIASDAVTSSSTVGHRGAVDMLLARFDRQVDVATVAEICAAWGAAAEQGSREEHV